MTSWAAAHQSSLSITISWSLLKLLSIELVMPSNHLILCCPLLLPSIFPRIRVFSNESDLHIRWPNCWSFSFTSVPPTNIQDWFPFGLTGLISMQSKRLSRVFSNTTVQKHQSSVLSFLYSPTLTAFLPRSKRLLISWLPSPSAVILEPKKSLSLFPLFFHLFSMAWCDLMPWS